MTSNANLVNLCRELKVEPIISVGEIIGSEVDSELGGKIFTLDSDFEKFLLITNRSGSHELIFSDISLGGLVRAKQYKKSVEESLLSACQIRPAEPAAIEYFRSGGKSSSGRALTDENSSITKLMVELSTIGMQRNASDIYLTINQEDNSCRVEMRVDGIVSRCPNPVINAADALRLCGVLINWEATKPGCSRDSDFSDTSVNNASFYAEPKGFNRIKVRYNHIPSANPQGLTVTMRLHPDSVIPTYEKRGYSPEEANELKRAFKTSEGLVLFTGPTGSGKTTAMAIGLNCIPDVRRLSIEDPVEIIVPGMVQIQVNRDVEGLDWHGLVQQFLRQAPDVIMLGEMRHPEVAQVGLQAAGTGHLVISTLHTNSAIESISRLHDLGVSQAQLCTPKLLRVLIAQRLVRLLCPECSVPLLEAYAKDEDEHRKVYTQLESNPLIKSLDQVRTRRPTGCNCSTCESTGYIGRTPLIEIVKVDEIGRKFIASRDLLGWETHLRKAGWESMADKGLKHIATGAMCPHDLESAIEGSLSQWGIHENNK